MGAHPRRAFVSRAAAARRGVELGYSGGGPATLAQLLDRLLDDMNAPAPGPGTTKEPPPGLLAGATGGWPEAGVVLSRAELLAARGER